jgi:oligoribonuclease (3'-5' exoribonuclease)
MVHLNGNLLCAVDVETTGVDPQKNDIWQIAVLPLDANIKPLQGIMPFYVNMRLKRPENIDPKAMNVGKADLAQLQLHAIDPWKAVDLFIEWFERLGLPEKKRIAPLASNWLFDRDFIIEWMGRLSFDYYFHFHYRDTQASALFMNDRADRHIEKVPHPKVGLGYLGNLYGAQNLKAHDALQDCLQTAEVYSKMMSAYTPLVPGTKMIDPPPIN